MGPPKPGSSKDSAGSYAAASSNASSIPRDLSFLIRVDPLLPNYAVQGNRKLDPTFAARATGDESYPNIFWAPPNIRGAYLRSPATWFRWTGGRVTGIAANDPARHRSLESHSVATIFTQRPDTTHLLAVDFDAGTRDVVSEPGGWKVLNFNHVRKDHNSHFSSLDLLGAEAHLAAPGSPLWVEQLLPSVYDYQEVDDQGNRIPPRTKSAGLIGSLPLLISLAVFSAPQNMLAHALQSLQPGRWQPHNYPDGRGVSERGMVVTIFYDPSNPKGSNDTLLNCLQNGDYGAFYG